MPLGVDGAQFVANHCDCCAVIQAQGACTCNRPNVGTSCENMQDAMQRILYFSRDYTRRDQSWRRLGRGHVNTSPMWACSPEQLQMTWFFERIGRFGAHARPVRAHARYYFR
jgi:hypothetical protein